MMTDSNSRVVFADTDAASPRKRPAAATRNVFSGAETSIAMLASQKTVQRSSVRNSTEQRTNSGKTAAMIVPQIANRRS